MNLQLASYMHHVLDTMGNTPDEVADCLRRANKRCDNPVISFAEGHYPVKAKIRTRYLVLTEDDGTETSVQMLPPVIEFLERFHRGEYPDLQPPKDHDEHT